VVGVGGSVLKPPTQVMVGPSGALVHEHSGGSQAEAALLYSCPSAGVKQKNDGVFAC